MIFRFRTGFLISVALISVGAALAFSQTQGQPPLTFGTGIEIINLTVTVTDAQGHLVPGLGREAFARGEGTPPEALAAGYLRAADAVPKR